MTSRSRWTRVLRLYLQEYDAHIILRIWTRVQSLRISLFLPILYLVKCDSSIVHRNVSQYLDSLRLGHALVLVSAIALQQSI